MLDMMPRGGDVGCCNEKIKQVLFKISLYSLFYMVFIWTVNVSYHFLYIVIESWPFWIVVKIEQDAFCNVSRDVRLSFDGLSVKIDNICWSTVICYECCDITIHTCIHVTSR